MIPEVGLEAAFSWGMSGMGAGLGFFAVRWVAIFVAGRWDKKEAQIDAGTRRLIEQLEHQIDALTKREESREQRLSRFENDLADCKRLHAESEAEVMRLKAMLQGYGDARQIQQVKRAADKIVRERDGE